MINSQSNTESMNNKNRQNSPGYSNRKPSSVTFTTDTIQCENGCVPNLRNQGKDVNNEHLSKMIIRRHKPKITVIWKPGILNCNGVVEYTNSSDSNICDRCNKELQDKSNQIWSLNMVLVREIDAEQRVINVEQPFD